MLFRSLRFIQPCNLLIDFTQFIQESWGTPAVGFPKHDFELLPQKGTCATEPSLLPLDEISLMQ